MKKSKLLFLVPSVAIATSIPFISSCSKHGLLIEDIEDAIFHPIQTEQKVSGTYVEQLKSVGKNDLQKELIYRLFAAKEPWADGIKEWYEAGEVNMLSNIQTCDIKFNENKVVASFVGYINFVFIKDSQRYEYKKGDIVQVTFIFDNLDVTPTNGSWYLDLHLKDPTKEVFGFIEQIVGGERKLPWAIYKLDPQTIIQNWHYWHD